MSSSVTGGKEYSQCQMDEPVNPLTTFTPSFRAARAVCFISWMAHCALALGVAGQLRRDPVVGPVVEGVEDELAGEMVADRPDFRPYFASRSRRPVQ